MKNPPEATLVLLGEDNTGRDEMNLAGNPFALLQAASRAGQTLIKSEWERTLPNGRIVTAKWEVNGHAELGLPGPNEELLYLVLLQLTRKNADENGVWPRQVHFGRGEVLSMMKWNDSAPTYRTLSDCFKRLSNVQINTEFAFWNARAKAPYEAVSFGLIDDYGIAAEPRGRKEQGALPLSWFRWNETLHESFLAGNVRSLALEFVLSLNLPTSRRLFRFLDMMRGATTPPRREFAIGLFKLCERLGMTSYKYASKLKEKLEPAIQELIERNYLEEVRFEKSKDGNELAYFSFGKVARVEPEQGSVEVIYAKPEKKPVKPTKKPPIPETTTPSDVRLDAIRCHAVFAALEESERNELLELAKKEVSPIWHDRLGLPESPMSLGLWQLVAQRYPERLK